MEIREQEQKELKELYQEAIKKGFTREKASMIAMEVAVANVALAEATANNPVQVSIGRALAEVSHLLETINK